MGHILGKQMSIMVENNSVQTEGKHQILSKNQLLDERSLTTKHLLLQK